MLDYLVQKLRVNPLFQGGLVLFVVLLFMAMTGMTLDAESTENERMQPWILSATGLLFFAIWNTVFGLLSEKFSIYYMKSIFAFLGYVVLTIFIAQWVSGTSVFDAKSMQWIYTIFTIGYIVLLAIITMMRRIVRYAQNEDRRTFPMEHKDKNI